jgi:hypothetical protein
LTSCFLWANFRSSRSWIAPSAFETFESERFTTLGGFYAHPGPQDSEEKAQGILEKFVGSSKEEIRKNLPTNETTDF